MEFMEFQKSVYDRFGRFKKWDEERMSKKFCPLIKGNCRTDCMFFKEAAVNFPDWDERVYEMIPSSCRKLGEYNAIY